MSRQTEAEKAALQDRIMYYERSGKRIVQGKPDTETEKGNQQACHTPTPIVHITVGHLRFALKQVFI